MLKWLREAFCWHELRFVNRLRLVRKNNWLESVPVTELCCWKCGADEQRLLSLWRFWA
jgi:hypothetical protein